VIFLARSHLAGTAVVTSADVGAHLIRKGFVWSVVQRSVRLGSFQGARTTPVTFSHGRPREPSGANFGGAGTGRVHLVWRTTDQLSTSCFDRVAGGGDGSGGPPHTDLLRPLIWRVPVSPGSRKTGWS